MEITGITTQPDEANSSLSIRELQTSARNENEAIFALSLDAVLSRTIQQASNALSAHGATPQGTSPFETKSFNSQSSFSSTEPINSDPQRSTQSAHNQQSSIQPGHSQGSPSVARPVISDNPNGNPHIQAGAVQTGVGQIGAGLSSLPSSLGANPQAVVAKTQLNNATAPRTIAETTAFSSPSVVKYNVATRLPAGPPPAPASPLTQTNFSRILAARLSNGDTHFEIRLDPPELGRIDVSLSTETGKSSKLTLTFENQSTRDLFRQDIDNLQSLLSDSGLDADRHDLAFNLSSDRDNRSANETAKTTRTPVTLDFHSSSPLPHHSAVITAHLINIHV